MLYNGRHAKSEKDRWFYNSLFWLSDKYKVRTFDVFLNMSKFTHFLEDQKDQKSALGGPKLISRTGVLPPSLIYFIPGVLSLSIFS